MSSKQTIQISQTRFKAPRSEEPRISEPAHFPERHFENLKSTPHLISESPLHNHRRQTGTANRNRVFRIPANDRATKKKKVRASAAIDAIGGFKAATRVRRGQLDCSFPFQLAYRKSSLISLCTVLRILFLDVGDRGAPPVWVLWALETLRTVSSYICLHNETGKLCSNSSSQ